MVMLMITHALGIVAKVCDFVGIMYAGRIVECGHPGRHLWQPAPPLHRGLFDSLPDIENGRAELKPIPGLIPDPMNLPPGMCLPSPLLLRETGMFAGPPPGEVVERHALCLLPPVQRNGENKLSTVDSLGEILLEVKNLKKYFHGGCRNAPRRGRRELHDRGRADPGSRGRVGLRQDHPGAHHPAAHRAHQRRDALQRQGPPQIEHSELRYMRREDADHLPGPLLQLNPRKTIAETIEEPILHGRPHPGQRQALHACAGSDGHWWAWPNAHQHLPPRARRRPPPACRHRPGLGHQSQVHRLRRARVLPGRVHPGPDPQPPDGPSSEERASPTSSSPTTSRW